MREKGVKVKSRFFALAHWNLPLVLTITFILWIVTTIAKILFNGLIFEFDYGLFHPDGAFYTFRTLLFSGYDKFEAGRMVADWYAVYPAKPAAIDPTSLFFENAPGTWDQYGPRILYPLLSVPFVKIFGIWGMLVVPALTYLVVLIATAYIAYKTNRVGTGLIIIILITSSATISRWMYINATDGLLMLFTALFVILIYKNQDFSLTRIQLFGTLFLIVLSSLTRFSALMWLFVGCLFLLHRKYREGSLISAVSIIGAIPIFLRPFGNDVLPELNEKSNLEKVLNYPISFARISIYEIGQLFVLDRIFFWVLILAFVLAIFNIGRIQSQFFIASFVSLWITGSLNAVLGVNFRYQLALVPFLLWLLVALLPSITWTHSRNLSGNAEARE